MEIAIPPIDVQMRILETYDKFDELEKDLASLKIGNISKDSRMFILTSIN